MTLMPELVLALVPKVIYYLKMTHLNMTNATVTLVASSATCYTHVHVKKSIYAPQMLHISHIHQLLNVNICNNYDSLYASYGLHAINNVTRNSGIHIFHIMGI